jgi:Helix-turn-helix domain
MIKYINLSPNPILNAEFYPALELANWFPEENNRILRDKFIYYIFGPLSPCDVAKVELKTSTHYGSKQPIHKEVMSPVNFEERFASYPDVLTAKELARVLRIDVKTARDFCEKWKSKIGAQTIGKQYRILKSSMIKWFMDTHRSQQGGNHG